MEIIAPIFGLIGMFIAIVIIVRMALQNASAKRETNAQLQLHSHLIDKFGSPNELGEYLQSEAGRRFLAPVRSGTGTPHRRILAASQTGIVLTFLGAAMWPIRGAFDQEGARALLFLGNVALGLGLGFIVSAVVAHTLSRKWGLFNGKENAADSGR